MVGCNIYLSLVNQTLFSNIFWFEYIGLVHETSAIYGLVMGRGLGCHQIAIQ